jgi:hypothetical protein
MASVIISGTFAATGSSDVVSCHTAVIDLTFAGTATVNIQWAVDGSTFRTIQSVTASTQYVFEPGVHVPLRLNCSSHTNNVTYCIRTY